MLSNINLTDTLDIMIELAALVVAIVSLRVNLQMLNGQSTKPPPINNRYVKQKYLKNLATWALRVLQSLEKKRRKK